MLIDVSQALFGYGGRAIVRCERLALERGARFGVFGPNGSGKTTLVRGVTGLLPPMSGQVRRSPGLRIGYLPQHRSVEPHWPMTGLDAASLAFSTRRRFGWIGRDRAAILSQLERLEVADLAERPLARLSGGQQQRILLAGALAASPELLVLDEPTEGLDVRSRRILLDALQAAAEDGLCTIMISHVMDDLASLCRHVAWFNVPEEANRPSEVEVVEARHLPERVRCLQSEASAA